MAPKKGKKTSDILKDMLKDTNLYHPPSPSYFHDEYPPIHPAHSPHSHHAPKPPLWEKLEKANLSMKDMELLFQNRICPMCGHEATDLSWTHHPQEITTMGGHVQMMPGHVTIRMSCPHGHMWEFPGPPPKPVPPPPPEPWTGPNHLFLEGVVDAAGHPISDYGPMIGEMSLLPALAGAFDLRPQTPAPEVQVMLGIEPQAALGELAGRVGKLSTYEGAPGSEVTPAEPPEILVGDWNLIEKLYEFDGRSVALNVELADKD